MVREVDSWLSNHPSGFIALGSTWVFFLNAQITIPQHGYYPGFNHGELESRNRSSFLCSDQALFHVFTPAVQL